MFTRALPDQCHCATENACLTQRVAQNGSDVVAHLKMNPNWENEIRKHIQPALEERARIFQGVLDPLYDEYQGRSVEEIKPVLEREWTRMGGTITEPELTKVATHISEGVRIQFHVE